MTYNVFGGTLNLAQLQLHEGSGKCQGITQCWRVVTLDDCIVCSYCRIITANIIDTSKPLSS